MTPMSRASTALRRICKRASQPFAMGRPIPRLPHILFGSSIATVAIVLGFSLWMVKPVGDWRLTVFSYACVGVGVAISVLNDGFWLDFRLKLAFLFCAAVGSGGYLLGLINSNQGANSEFIFFVALPLTWGVLVAGAHQPVVRAIVNTIPFVTIAFSLVGIAYWLLRVTQFPILNPFFVIDLGLSVEPVLNGWSMGYYAISTLVFVIPFLFMSIVVPRSYSSVSSQWAAWPALALALFLMLISGRRVLLVSLALSIALGFLILFLRRGGELQRRRMYIVAAVSGIGGLLLALVSNFSLTDMAASLVVDELGSDSVRGDSIVRLTQSWLLSPLWGNGLGAEVDGLTRSKDTPWAFEVQYHLVLNALGLFGFIVLASSALMLILLSARIFHSGPNRYAYIAPILTGTIATLIANATNPYLHTPGHYWMLFFLVLATNSALQSRNDEGTTVTLLPSNLRRHQFHSHAQSSRPSD